MNHRSLNKCFASGLTVAWVISGALVSLSSLSAEVNWRIHDLSRPNPIVIDPGSPSTADRAGIAPSDAVVLFDGRDLSQWRSMNGESAQWIVRDQVMESVAGGGYIRTLRSFGDCQLHVEFATPVPVQGSSQGRGNSGVFLMGVYEVQVLDSYQNRTYADGQASAIYGQYPPEVNACRPPGQWQTYDIIFRAPRFDSGGQLEEPARITVLQNGVITQNAVTIKGPTSWCQNPPYRYHPEKLPISLQDHGNPVRYRNIWVRELPAPKPGEPAPRPELLLSDQRLNTIAGHYEFETENHSATFTREGQAMIVCMDGDPNRTYPVFAESPTQFYCKRLQAEFEFNFDDDGRVNSLQATITDSVWRNGEKTR